MTATIDVDASVVGPRNHSSQDLLSFSSQTPPVQPSHSTTTSSDTVKIKQSDDEQSGVKHSNEAGANNNNQTDDDQSWITNGHETAETKPAS